MTECPLQIIVFIKTIKSESHWKKKRKEGSLCFKQLLKYMIMKIPRINILKPCHYASA